MTYQLDIATGIKHYIFGFQIAVQDVPMMKIGQAFKDTGAIEASVILSQRAAQPMIKQSSNEFGMSSRKA